MTDLATAMADTSMLPEYGHLPVIRTVMKLTNAGDGLSAGLAIDPQVLPLGATVFVVLECVVDSHEHDRILDKGNDTGLLVLSQVLKAGTGTLVDGEVVGEAIRKQAERITTARELAEGKARLPYPDELERAHAAGDHASGLVPGCPPCDSEVAAVEDEAPPAPTPIGRRKTKEAEA